MIVQPPMGGTGTESAFLFLLHWIPERGVESNPHPENSSLAKAYENDLLDRQKLK